MNLQNRNQYEINLDDYKIVEHIFDGDFGVIYKIKKKKSQNNNEIYVAKVLKSNDLDESKMYREIDILIELQHFTIIKFYGYSLKDFRKKNNITIIMEYAPNGSLFKFLNQRPIPSNYDDTAKQIIIAGISRGMMIFHDHNSLHRDLKPANILLDENLYPRIADFSLSKKIETGDSFDQSTSDCTPLYMAPEMYDGTHYNQKVDVYAFGLVLYEILTGMAPFEDAPKGYHSFKDYIQKGLRPKFDSKKPLKNSLQNLIKKCWDNDPNKRPTFSDIYDQIAFNKEFYLENVNIDKLFNYLTIIDDDFREFMDLSNIEKYSKFKKTTNELKSVKDENLENCKKKNDLLFCELNELKDEVKKMIKKDGEMLDEISILKDKLVKAEDEKKELENKISSVLEKLDDSNNENNQNTIPIEEDNTSSNPSLLQFEILRDSTSVYRPKEHH